MNQSQIDSQRRQVETEVAEIDKAISEAVSTKSYGTMSDLEARIDRLADAREDLDRAEAAHKSSAKFAALAADASSYITGQVWSVNGGMDM
jgi:NAD(P)-dependent dehydrogenase (short-subunit alcohol dehydrogenase family)